MLKPCAHSAAKYGMEATAWQTQLCGLCLGLRDGHGQLARAATNTDAIVLGVLTEAQQTRTLERTAAGPCPLRGMRTASVAPADSPGVQLAATASLLLGAAKIRDHIDDGDTRRLSKRPMAHVANRWHTRARAAAAPIGLDIDPLITAIESQVALEESGATLAELTAPTQLCAAELFAHTAILAGRPENADALREAGWHFGRIAHLADAIEDIDEDREAGRFNPLTATGTSTTDAHALLRESNSLLKAALVTVGLDRTASIRWMLLDPLHGVVRKLGRAAGTVHACATHACGTARHSAETVIPAADLRHPGMFVAGIHTTAVDPGQKRAGMTGDGTANGPHAVFGTEPPRTPFRRPGFWEGVGIGLSQYCTGYACCAEHTSPCSGERKDSWINRGCCDCSDCCDCGDCCSGCDCCDCDCCGCDCNC
ncbi:DUF5685 family protein [Nocardia sp. NPDC058058]|uniref:DUF5685 family protein n=1 Tax=Nocardia sp. NPDC058058 TaxID=3346317 RepID=UPI0036DC6BD7